MVTSTELSAPGVAAGDVFIEVIEVYSNRKSLFAVFCVLCLIESVKDIFEPIAGKITQEPSLFDTMTVSILGSLLEMGLSRLIFYVWLFHCEGLKRGFSHALRAWLDRNDLQFHSPVNLYLGQVPGRRDSGE
jgi:hypothetical protein